MLYIILESVGKNDYIVNKNSAMSIINSQCSVYKTVYIKWRIYISYKDHLRTFYFSLVDKSKSITVIQIYKKLKNEVEYIDYRNIPFSIDRIDNILL